MKSIEGLCAREEEQKKSVGKILFESRGFQDHFTFASSPHRLDSPSIHFFYIHHRSGSETSVHSSNSVYKISIVPSPIHSGLANLSPQCLGDCEVQRPYTYFSNACRGGWNPGNFENSFSQKFSNVEFGLGVLHHLWKQVHLEETSLKKTTSKNELCFHEM